MVHTKEDLIQEFRNAIEKLVPLTPKEIIEEANRLAGELETNETVTSEQIRQALVYLGRKEFPYRRAYLELCAGDEEARMQKIILEKLDDGTKAFLDPVTKYGVHILDFLESSQFEALADDMKVKIDNVVRQAHDIVNRQCDERATSRAESYRALVKQWTEEGEDIQKRIDVLKEMAERDPQWHDDILNKARQFENGFSMIEDDPTKEGVEQEIAHWAGIFSGSEEGTDSVE